MAVMLHPRAASGAGLQVWLGVTGLTRPPTLDWRLDGVPVSPTVVRPVASARTPEMVDAPTPRTFTGVFTFPDGIVPGSTHDVSVTSDSGETATLRTRALPAALSGDGFETFNVMLASCFDSGEDARGAVGTLVARLPVPHRPHLTLLAGDQVYLDLPTLMNFKGNLPWLADKFERSYVRNWFSPLAYARVLQAAPSAAVPDDHEYWNNAPHASPVVWESIGEASRKNWLTAAEQMYVAFQRSEPGGYDPVLELDVSPLSFFLMDNRTFRRRDLSQALPHRPHPLSQGPPGQFGLDQFRRWTRRVAEQDLYGVVITGQSLFRPPAPWLKARIADRQLADYGDYPDIFSAVLDLARAGRPVLCLTGDVHFGRVISAVEESTGARLYEAISSPTSLVSTVGFDQFSALENAASSLFGHRDPTHRHRNAPDVPARFTPRGVDTTLRLDRLFPEHEEKGDHVALLRFRRIGFGAELTINYWMVETGRPVPEPHGLTITLAPTS